MIVSLLFALTVFVYTWYTAEEQSDLAESTMTAQTQSLAKNVAGAAIVPLLAADYAGMEMLLLQSADYPEIRLIGVFDASGKLLSQVRKDERGKPFADFALSPLSVPQTLEASAEVLGSGAGSWLAGRADPADAAALVALVSAAVDRLAGELAAEIA